MCWSVCLFRPEVLLNFLKESHSRDLILWILSSWATNKCGNHHQLWLQSPFSFSFSCWSSILSTKKSFTKIMNNLQQCSHNVPNNEQRILSFLGSNILQNLFILTKAGIICILPESPDNSSLVVFPSRCQRQTENETLEHLHIAFKIFSNCFLISFQIAFENLFRLLLKIFSNCF